MLLQKNADINIMTHQELKSDLEESEKKGDYTQTKVQQELKWRPAKNAKESRKIVPLFQVFFFNSAIVSYFMSSKCKFAGIGCEKYISYFHCAVELC